MIYHEITQLFNKQMYVNTSLVTVSQGLSKSLQTPQKIISTTNLQRKNSELEDTWSLPAI